MNCRHHPAPLQPARRHWLAHAAAWGASPWVQGVTGGASVMALTLALTPAAQAQTTALEPRQLVERWRQTLVTVEYHRAAQSSAARGPSGLPPSEDLSVNEFLDRFLGSGSSRALGPADPTVINSGTLISADGWVLSLGLDAPAIGEQATVRTDDGRLWPARYVGGDRTQSMVLFKLESAQPFPFMPLPPTAPVQGLPAVGERVVALGRVWFKKQGSVAATEGLVSAVLSGKAWQPATILTTASIVTSMGGGPLFSLSTGQLLGLCGQYFTQPRSGVTITAAQPLAAILASVREIQQTGPLQRPWLGVFSNEPNADARKRLGPDSGGAAVSRVEAAGPAERAGMKAGDIVLRLDDVPIEEPEHLNWLIRNLKPGSAVKLEVLRGTERLTLGVTLEPLRPR
jgi:serine protease Do